MWTNDILGGLQVTTIKTRKWGTHWIRKCLAPDIMKCVKVYVRISQMHLYITNSQKMHCLKEDKF